MIADLGTRRCTSIETVNNESEWINGYPWMRQESLEFPALTADEISLNAQEVQQIKKECKEPVTEENLCFVNSSIHKVPEEVSKFYKYSKYLIDPNYCKFQTVVRIMAYVMKFTQNCLSSKSNSQQKAKHFTLSDGCIH